MLRAENHDAVFNYLLGNVDRNVQDWEPIMLITFHFSYLETNHALTETQEPLEWLGFLRSSLKISIFRRTVIIFSDTNLGWEGVECFVGFCYPLLQL